MTATTFDAIVIGTGQGGLSTALGGAGPSPAALTVALAWRPTNPSPLVHAFTTMALAARDDHTL